MSFVLGQIVVPLILAVGLGVLGGWIIWGRGESNAPSSSAGGDAATADVDRLRVELAELRQSAAHTKDRLAESHEEIDQLADELQRAEADAEHWRDVAERER